MFTVSYLQNNQSKMDGSCHSSNRVPALQAQGPEFKPPNPTKKQTSNYKPLANLTKRRRENIQIKKIKVEKGDITINADEIHRIMKEYLKYLYSNQLERLEEMDKFLDAFDPPTFNKEEVIHLNCSTTSNDIEAIAKILSKKKIPGPY
jgi:hypothetical protein